MSFSVPGAPGRPPDQVEKMDDDGFTVPIVKKRGRGRPRKTTNADDTNSVVSNTSVNTFMTLSDDDPGDVSHLPKKSRVVKPKRPPPIVIPNLNTVKDVEAILVAAPINKSNILRRITKDGTKLFVTTPDEFKSLREHLKTTKVKFTSYTLHEDMVSRYVMYGLPKHDIREVYDALKNALTQEPHDLKEMKINKKSYPDQANYLIYFKKSAGITLANLKTVTGILGYRVFFSRYEKGVQPTQCYNCQRYSHASANCWMEPRCMRCSGPHKSSECCLLDKTSKKIPDDKVKCINCDGNHTSNSNECPTRIKLTKERRELADRRLNTVKRTRYAQEYRNNYDSHFPANKSTRVVDNPNTRRNTTVTNGISYSQSVKTGITQPIDDSNSDLFSPQELLQILRDMVRICSSCRTKEDQILALTAIVEKYVCHD